MSRKRSNFEISADILKVAMGGARKSHIVYKANLNFEIVKGYLKELTSSGLLKGPDQGSKLFSTTEKGIEYLKYLDGMKQFTV